MTTWMTIGILVELLRMVVRYIRKLWTFKDLENPIVVLVIAGNLVLTSIIWPITIVWEIVEYFMRKNRAL